MGSRLTERSEENIDSHSDKWMSSLLIRPTNTSEFLWIPRVDSNQSELTLRKHLSNFVKLSRSTLARTRYHSLLPTMVDLSDSHIQKSRRTILSRSTSQTVRSNQSSSQSTVSPSILPVETILVELVFSNPSKSIQDLMILVTSRTPTVQLSALESATSSSLEMARTHLLPSQEVKVLRSVSSKRNNRNRMRNPMPMRLPRRKPSELLDHPIILFTSNLSA